jgi:hypothetical protein
MRENPFAESEDRRADPPGSIPGTGMHRQVGSVDLPGGPAGRGWSLGYVGAYRSFAVLFAVVVAIGLGIWLVSLLLG